MRVLTTMAIGMIAFCCSAGTTFAKEGGSQAVGTVDKCVLCFDRPGIVGPTGPTGPTGATGATGIDGSKGEVGPMGEQGPIGPMGEQGVAGQNGIIGVNGATGAIETADYIETVTSFKDINPRDSVSEWELKGPGNTPIPALFFSQHKANGTLGLGSNGSFIGSLKPFSAPYSIKNNGTSGLFNVSFYVSMAAGQVGFGRWAPGVRIEKSSDGLSWQEAGDFAFTPVLNPGGIFYISAGTRECLMHLEADEQIRFITINGIDSNWRCYPEIIQDLNLDTDLARVVVRRVTTE